MLLRYMEELSYEAIAIVLEKPLGTVKTYLHRGRKELAAHLSTQGYGPRETLARLDP